MTSQLQRGQRAPLSQFTAATRFTIQTELPMPTPPDISIFGLDEARRLSDDRYFIFYNQLSSPERAIAMDEQTQVFTIDLGLLPLGIHRLLLASTSDAEPFSALGRGQVTLKAQGQEVLRFPVAGVDFQAEQAIMLLEVYRHQGAWRVAGVGQGFAGGLRALLESMGGEVEEPEAAAAPAADTWPRLKSAPEQYTETGQCRRCGKVRDRFLRRIRLDQHQLCPDCAQDLKDGLDRFRVRFQAACADGIMERHEWQDLQDTILLYHLNAQEALKYVRADALYLLERTVALARADGVLTNAEEAEFNRLAELLDVPDAMLNNLRAELEELRSASRIREGHLPTIKSRLILESGEVAHLEVPATFRHVTSSKVRDIPGRLVLTSKQMHFTSNEGGWNVQYSKVLRIEEISGGVNVELGVKKGSGLYRTERPLILAATLDALVRSYKRLLLMPQTERASRSIPQSVKLAVWQRDQGKCVECGATEYLEFDHIIPHSKGGASSEGNLQLLCRKCNLAKSDRI
ncbi:hypothetical protein DKM44_02130 [Deinococcus irradiatisoli]|uniref:HNH nuclease domain-containing protein n=1 Tax=Deinococcus irradiatisoli TaxID=2202254 RepID=A0A2Z3JAP7_9DEIO|nr:TerD family protein [Deinococcus irradiatisoli]AWN22177.1 hypothetical protein DKM44_02130 [Deinococcus irradiatisoli]